MSEKFLQTFDKDGDVVFVGLKDGILYWTLPTHGKPEEIAYLTHFSDKNKYYYEDAKSRVVHWSLPEDDKRITSRARSMVADVNGMSRAETSEYIGFMYSAEAASKQMEELSRYFNTGSEPATATHGLTTTVETEDVTKEQYMQSFNGDLDPIFIGLLSGKVFWTIPAPSKVSDLAVLTHATEEGKFYYETIATQAVTWSIPNGQTLPDTVIESIQSMYTMSTQETEDIVGLAFSEVESNRQMELIQKFIDGSDAGIKSDAVDNNASTIVSSSSGDTRSEAIK